VSDLLTAAAAAMNAPESLIQRSAAARASANGISVDEVLAAWAGGAPAAPPAAPATTAPAAEPEPEVAAEAPAEPMAQPVAQESQPEVIVEPAPVFEPEPVPELEPVPIGRRIRTATRVGGWTGAVLGLVGFLVATTWWAGTATVIGEGPYTPVIQATTNAVIIGAAIVSLLFGAIVAGLSRASASWTNPGMQLSNSPASTAWLGALVGLVLGVVAGAILTGFGTPIEGSEGMVQLPVLPTMAVMLIGGALLGAITAAATQAVAVPVAVAGDDEEIAAVKGRLGGALTIPLVGLLLLLLLVLPFAFALLESMHFAEWAAPLIAVLTAAGILGFASLAGSRPNIKIRFGDVMVAIIGIATVIIVIFYVLIVGTWDDEPEGDEGGEEAAIAFVVD
jgi:hypothetical protein